jgi:hypothetical protein
MSKKLMLLAAGALTALAFAALPAVASAGEYILDCETGAGKVCEGTVAGGASSLSNGAGETITCTGVEGTATATGGTSTGTLSLIFVGCHETVTIFHFTCNSSGLAAGRIATGSLQSHVINIEHGGTTPGILVTNANVTFECTGFSKKTVTGNVIGHLENPQCNTFAVAHTANFTASAHGIQAYTQVTTTGTIQDLIQNNDAGGAYQTSAQVGTGTITWKAGDKVNITC